MIGVSLDRTAPSPYVARMPSPSAAAVSRRAFVRATLGTALGAGVAVGAGACTSAPPTLPPAWRTPALLDALGADRVRRIGAAWRNQHPAERTPEALSKALRMTVERLPTLPAAGSDSAPAEALARAIVGDFEADRIVVVDGWMLAVTEARQCALYALSGT